MAFKMGEHFKERRTFLCKEFTWTLRNLQMGKQIMDSPCKPIAYLNVKILMS